MADLTPIVNMSVDTVLDRSGNVRDTVNIELPQSKFSFDASEIPPQAVTNIFRGFKYETEYSSDFGQVDIAYISPDLFISAAIAFPEQVEKGELGHSHSVLSKQTELAFKDLNNNDNISISYAYANFAALKLTDPTEYDYFVKKYPAAFEKVKSHNLKFREGSKSGFAYSNFINEVFYRKILFPTESVSKLLRDVLRGPDFNNIKSQIHPATLAQLKLTDQVLFKQLGFDISEDTLSNYIIESKKIEHNIYQPDQMKYQIGAIFTWMVLAADTTQILPDGSIQVIQNDPFRRNLVSAPIPEVGRFQE